jgi:hypothetical protein
MGIEIKLLIVVRGNDVNAISMAENTFGSTCSRSSKNFGAQAYLMLFSHLLIILTFFDERIPFYL